MGEIAGLEVVDLVVEDFDAAAQAMDFGRVLLDHRRVLLRDQLDLVDRLDGLTRSLFPWVDRDGLGLTSVRWLPPPDETQFVLSYRFGDEERSSCGNDLTVDAVAPGIVSDLTLDC